MREGGALSRAATVGMVIVASSVLGYAVVRFQTLAIIGVIGAVVLYVAYRPELRWLAVGMMTLAYMNAIPFVDLVQTRLPAGIRFDDIVLAAMTALGVAWTWSVRRDSPLGRLRFMLGVYVAYWLFVLTGTVVTGGGTLGLSALYGRDMLAIVMCLAIASVARTESDQERFIIVIIGGACLYALAHAIQFGTGLDTGFITHPYKLGESLGTVRIFSKAMSLVVPAFVIALGRALVLTDPHKKLGYWAAASVLCLEILIEFTRANYLGLIFSVVFGGIMIGRLRTDQPHSRAAVALSTIGATAGIVWLMSGSQAVRAWLTGSAVVGRIASTSTDLAAQGGTFGYRLRLYELTGAIVGGSWLTGVGFWHPEEHYVPVLPQGSIRNNDTGILATYATMGVIGVGLLLWILVTAGRWSAAALKSSSPWIQASGWSTIAFIAWVILTSFSLGFLAHGAGLMATAIVVGIMTGSWQAETDSAVGEAR